MYKRKQREKILKEFGIASMSIKSGHTSNNLPSQMELA